MAGHLESGGEFHAPVKKIGSAASKVAVGWEVTSPTIGWSNARLSTPGGAVEFLWRSMRGRPRDRTRSPRSVGSEEIFPVPHSAVSLTQRVIERTSLSMQRHAGRGRPVVVAQVDIYTTNEGHDPLQRAQPTPTSMVHTNRLQRWLCVIDHATCNVGPTPCTTRESTTTVRGASKHNATRP
jgi:hypothetical protein